MLKNSPKTISKHKALKLKTFYEMSFLVFYAMQFEQITALQRWHTNTTDQLTTVATWSPPEKSHIIPRFWGPTTICTNVWVQSAMTWLLIIGIIISQRQQKVDGSAIPCKKGALQRLCKGKLTNAWGFGGLLNAHSKLL